MPKGRPREFDPEKALDKAMLLFWQHGYEGTSLAMLSDGMGINMPSLYAAFGNKEKLFGLCLSRYLKNPASYLPNAVNQPTARKVVEQLFRGAIDMVMNPKHPDGCMLVQAALAAGPEVESVRKDLAIRRAAAEKYICKRFERAVEEGDLPKKSDPAQLAKYAITVVWGMSVQAAGGASRADLEQVAKVALQAWPT